MSSFLLEKPLLTKTEKGKMQPFTRSTKVTESFISGCCNQNAPHKSDPRSPLKLPFLVEDVSAGMRQQDIGGGGAFELVALGTAWISSPQLRTAVSKIPFQALF